MPPEATIRIAVVDDHPLFRLGVRALLANEPGLALIGEAASGAEALALVAQHAPDVLLLDFLLPGIDGLEVLEQLSYMAHRVHVVLVTARMDEDEIRIAFARGARGVLLKHTASESLCSCIRHVMRGEYWADDAGMRALVHHRRAADAAPGPQLRPREQAIVELVAAGSSNKEIAWALGLGEQTVKNSLRRIFAKLHVESRVQLALYAVRNQLAGSQEQAARKCTRS